MRYAICLGIALVVAVVAQNGIVPAFLPAVLRPDAGILIAIALLCFCEREFGLLALFVLGLQADLFGSVQFGLLTLAYLLAAGVILLAVWREITRGDLLSAWLGGVAGTFLAHLFYLLLGRLCGLQVNWGHGMAVVMSMTLAAAVWGLPVAWAVSGLVNLCGVVSHPVKERWNAEARALAARRGKLLRA